jgi:hypothetical protein
VNDALWWISGFLWGWVAMSFLVGIIVGKAVSYTERQLEGKHRGGEAAESDERRNQRANQP